MRLTLAGGRAPPRDPLRELIADAAVSSAGLALVPRRRRRLLAAREQLALDVIATAWGGLPGEPSAHPWALMASAGRGPRSRGSPLSNVDAFEHLYFGTSQRLLVFMTRRSADPEVAADLWAETWARAFAARDRFRGRTRAEEEAWVFGIGRKVLAGFYKRGAAERRAVTRLGLERPELDDQDLHHLERLAGLDDLRQALAVALSDMPERQREALRLRVVEGRSYPEMSEELGVSEQTVRARVSRGLRALADTLEADRPDLEIPGS